MARINPVGRAEPPLFRLEPFKGMNLSVTPTQIDNAQSPDMLNMNIDERGALNKRTGYARVMPHSLGPGQINGMFLYRKADGNEHFLFAHADKLYKTLHVPNRDILTEQIWEDDDLNETWEV